MKQCFLFQKARGKYVDKINKNIYSVNCAFTLTNLKDMNFVCDLSANSFMQKLNWTNCYKILFRWYIHQLFNSSEY